MMDDVPQYLGISKIQINEAFLNQVASSRLRLQNRSSEAGSHAPSPSGPAAEEITPQMREQARAFIEEYFLVGDGDAP